MVGDGINTEIEYGTVATLGRVQTFVQTMTESYRSYNGSTALLCPATVERVRGCLVRSQLFWAF